EERRTRRLHKSFLVSRWPPLLRYASLPRPTNHRVHAGDIWRQNGGSRRYHRALSALHFPPLPPLLRVSKVLAVHLPSFEVGNPKNPCKFSAQLRSNRRRGVSSDRRAGCLARSTGWGGSA